MVSRMTGSVICRDQRRLYGILPPMPSLNIARVSTDQQDRCSSRGVPGRYSSSARSVRSRKGRSTSSVGWLKGVAAMDIDVGVDQRG